MEKTTTAPSERVPFAKKLAWGSGSITSNIALNSINMLAMPIYNIGLGVDAALIGIAMSLPRFLDAIFDPIMGVVSDNTRSRFGRRRPYMLVGSILLALFCLLLWIPPAHASANVIFGFFVVVSILYYFSFSIFQVPFTALGFELSSDYDERTRVQAVGTCLGLAVGLVLPWLYKLTLLDSFGGEVVGVRWVGGGVALILLVTGLIPTLMIKERAGLQVDEPVRLKTALLETLKNGSFKTLLAVTIIALAATFMVSAALLYINIYELCGGDKGAAATLAGWAGVVQLVAAFIGVPFHTWVSTHYGKRHAAIGAVLITVVGFIAYWWLLTPRMPYLQLICNAFVGFGIQGLWLLSASMLADVCDEDELHTGKRREGVYGSVMAFGQKAGLAVAALLGGFMLHMAGLVEGHPPTHEVLERLKLLFVVVQLVGMIVCLLLLARYPLSRTRVEEIRELLHAKKIA